MFDWVEVGRVGGQVAQFGTGSLDRLTHAIDLVRTQIVHEDDVALAKCRREDLFDIPEERRPIHGAVDDIGSGETIDAQRGYEGQRLPAAVRHASDDALAARRAPVVPDHRRRDCCLVDEDEAGRIEFRLLGIERGAPGGNITTILLGGVQRSF